ncbi:glycosyltransferase [Pedobacter sp.]|uniref:glycosyltransferase n=1 Tax=Pedobacter sp. TaxID=1411316 RepID=UPI003D7FFFAD
MKTFRRVILMTPSLSKGGAETQLVKVAVHLKANTNKVLIVSLKPINEFKGELEKNGLEVLFLKKWSTNSLSNLYLLYKSIKEFKPDVVIAFMFIAIIFARLYKLIFKYKLISTIRISVIQKKWYIPFIVTSALDDVLVYNSLASRKNFEGHRIVKKTGLVINNGITLPILQNFRNIENTTNNFIWICVAHFRWNKDYLTLFKAINLIKDRNFRIEIIGELNNEVWPFQIIKELNIENHVNIMGFKKDTAAYVKNADAFVLSSFSEGMPNSILEAMAHAKPVVVTDIDGNNELITEAKCGFLCEKQNEYDLAEKMIKVMDLTSAARKKYGENGRAYIESNFKDEKVMNNWMNLVNQITN